MRASCRQLNQCIQGAVDTAFYIDRIDIRVDDLSIRNEVQRLLTQADEKGLLHKFTLSPIRAGDKINQTFWKKGNTKGFKISLSRPRIRLLRKLCRPLLSAHYSISWLEIAYDIDTPSHDDAIDLVGLVADMVVVPSIANPPTFKDRENNITDAPQGLFTSVYFSQQDITNGKKNKKKENKMFKIYIPEGAAKLFGDTSLHSEFCIAGTVMIAQYGIWTIRDVARLDFSQWYKENVLVRSVDKTKIGGLIREQEGQSDAGVRQRQKDFDRKFGPGRALAHKLYHRDKKMRAGLTDCGSKWLSGSVW